MEEKRLARGLPRNLSEGQIHGPEAALVPRMGAGSMCQDLADKYVFWGAKTFSWGAFSENGIG